MTYSIYTRDERTELKKLVKLCDIDADSPADVYKKIKSFFSTSKRGRSGCKTFFDNEKNGVKSLYRLINEKQHEAFGYFFTEYNSKKQIFINASEKFRLNKTPVLNDFYIFDIETTHIGDRVLENGEIKPQAVCYLYGFKRFNFSEEKATSDYIAFYDTDAIQKVRDFLKELNEEAKSKNSYIVIYAHNLIVELTELFENIFDYEDIIELQENASNNLYRGSKSKPIVFQYGHLKFCDSLALLNKPLEKVAEDVGLIKNEQNKTYSEKWYLGSKLPKWELAYNESDLDITARGIIKLLKKAGFSSLTEAFKNNVVTATSLSKYINRQIVSDEQIADKRKYATLNLPIKNNVIDIERLKLWQNEVFKGGLCYANFLKCYMLLTDLISFDFASLYPSEMLLRQYPTALKTDKNSLKFLLTMHNCNYNKYIKVIYNFEKLLTFKNYKHIPYFFIATVTLENVKYKNFNNDNILLALADSKAREVINSVQDGEKILQADKVIISVSSIELLTYSLLYDFEITDAIIDCYTDEWRFLSDADIISLNYHGKNKFKSAQLIDLAKCGGDYSIFCRELGIDEKLFNSFSNDERVKFAEDLKNYFKQTGLNNQYGMNVQKIINDTFYYDYEKREYNTAEELQGISNNNTTERNYICGICITAYSRLDLITMYLNIEQYTYSTFVYCDTDSLKYQYYNSENKQKLIDLINAYNYYKSRYRAELENVFNSRIKDVEINLYNFGDFEHDGEYKYFKTLGTKTYCYYADGKIKKTIAGIKKNYDKFLNKKAAELGVEKTIDTYIASNLLLSSEVSGHMTTRQPNRELIQDVFIDDNGDEIKVNQYCSYTITPRQKWLQELSKLTNNRSHFELCKRFHPDVNFKMFDFKYIK